MLLVFMPLLTILAVAAQVAFRKGQIFRGQFGAGTKGERSYLITFRAYDRPPTRLGVWLAELLERSGFESLPMLVNVALGDASCSTAATQALSLRDQRRREREGPDLWELEHDCQDLRSSIQFCRNEIAIFGGPDGEQTAQRTYGIAYTAQMAIDRNTAEIERMEAELSEMEAELYHRVEGLWLSLYPYEDFNAVLATDDPGAVFMARSWEEIFNDFGKDWAEDGGAIASDVCVSMYEVLKAEGMRDLVDALRRGNNRKVTALLSRLSNHDRQKGYEVYNVVYTIPALDGTLRLKIEQRRNVGYAEEHHQRHRRSRSASSRRRRCGARTRSSKGKPARRTPGSRRPTSRSAGGGSSGDKSSGSDEPPGGGHQLHGPVGAYALPEAEVSL